LFVKSAKKPILRLVYLLLALFLFCSHNLYVKLETYFLEPNEEAIISLYNGTFEVSENTISRDRILDASFLVSGKRTAIDADQWKDKDSTITQLGFSTGAEGTYVLGVSTKARSISLTADKFNDYLLHDGVLDMLEQRRESGNLAKDVVESYEKHVKAIYQVGQTMTEDWKTPLDYPIEFVPQSNPYKSYTGGNLTVELLLNGQPLPNQLVYLNHIETQHAHSHQHNHDDGDASHEHHHGKEHSHQHGDEDASHKHEHQDDKHGQQNDHRDTHSHDHHHGEEGHSIAHSHQHDEVHEHHDHEGHAHEHGVKLRTNAEGLVTLDFPRDGIYYLRTIYMDTADGSQDVTHTSKWATLSFEITHKHEASGHNHVHHEHEDEIPTWGFVVFSFLIIGVLFFVFRRKN